MHQLIHTGIFSCGCMHGASSQGNGRDKHPNIDHHVHHGYYISLHFSKAAVSQRPSPQLSCLTPSTADDARHNDHSSFDDRWTNKQDAFYTGLPMLPMATEDSYDGGAPPPRPKPPPPPGRDPPNSGLNAPGAPPCMATNISSAGTLNSA